MAAAACARAPPYLTLCVLCRARVAVRACATLLCSGAQTLRRHDWRCRLRLRRLRGERAALHVGTRTCLFLVDAVVAALCLCGCRLAGMRVGALSCSLRSLCFTLCARAVAGVVLRVCARSGGKRGALLLVALICCGECSARVVLLFFLLASLGYVSLVLFCCGGVLLSLSRFRGLRACACVSCSRWCVVLFVFAYAWRVAALCRSR